MKNIQLLLNCLAIKRSAYLTIILLLYSCRPLMSLYDPYVYKETISLKVDTIELIEKMDKENYVDNKKQVEEVTTRLKKMLEYEQKRLQNTESALQWDIIINGSKLPSAVSQTGGILNLFKIWQQNGKVNEAFVPEAKKMITTAFDTILNSENSKIRKGVQLNKTE